MKATLNGTTYDTNSRIVKTSHGTIKNRYYKNGYKFVEDLYNAGCGDYSDSYRLEQRDLQWERDFAKSCYENDGW